MSDEEVAVPQVTGFERAVFGEVGADEIRARLGRHMQARLDADVSDIVFTARVGRFALQVGVSGEAR